MFTAVSRLIEEQVPLIAVTSDRIKAKDRVHRTHASVMLYCDFRYHHVPNDVINIYVYEGWLAAW